MFWKNSEEEFSLAFSVVALNLYVSRSETYFIIIRSFSLTVYFLSLLPHPASFLLLNTSLLLLRLLLFILISAVCFISLRWLQNSNVARRPVRIYTFLRCDWAFHLQRDLRLLWCRSAAWIKVVEYRQCYIHAEFVFTESIFSGTEGFFCVF